VQRTRQIVRRLQQILYQLCSREPHCIVPLTLEAAAEVLLLGQHAQEPLLELGRILLGRTSRLLSSLFWRSAFASNGGRGGSIASGNIASGNRVGRGVLCGVARLSDRGFLGCVWFFRRVRAVYIGSVF
jgi:hypothetical protein